MSLLVVAFMVGSLLIWLGGILVSDDKKSFSVGYMYTSTGVFILIIMAFFAAPNSLSTGRPAASIEVGEYGVAFVLSRDVDVAVGGDTGYVHVLTFKDGQNADRPMTYHRFPKGVFGGDIKTDATKLFVVESDGFKKLQLE